MLLHDDNVTYERLYNPINGGHFCIVNWVPHAFSVSPVVEMAADAYLSNGKLHPTQTHIVRLVLCNGLSCGPLSPVMAHQSGSYDSSGLPL